MNTIQLIGTGRHVEAVAAGAITPGHLIALTSADKVVVHGTAAGVAERYVATEDALQGKSINDAYATDDQVMGFLANPGDELLVFIKAGENIVIGDRLTSGGDGTLVKTAAATDNIVAVARQAINLTAGGAVATRIPVRFV